MDAFQWEKKIHPSWGPPTEVPSASINGVLKQYQMSSQHVLGVEGSQVSLYYLFVFYIVYIFILREQ